MRTISSEHCGELLRCRLTPPSLPPGYGMSQPCGHVDFYPNNGKEQPGCSGTDAPLPLTLIREGLEEASRVLVACSHVRAIKLFTDSINTPCPYIAHKCDSYEHFLEVREGDHSQARTIDHERIEPRSATTESLLSEEYVWFMSFVIYGD